MSATQSAALDQEELLSRIRRMNQETEKFVAESRKLNVEARKFDRDRFLAPLTATIALLAALASLASLYITRLH